MFKDTNQFYPTPNDLTFHLLQKLKDDNIFYNIKYILEPSAGKGDIVKGYIDFYKQGIMYKGSRFSYTDKEVKNKLKIDVIEYDNNLNSLLRGQGYNVVWDDFLTFTPNKKYDLVILNPPFINGAKHVLKAISLQSKFGGYVLAIINAETIKNPYSNERQELVNKLKEYNADIEYVKNAFSDAERKTGVEVALIYLKIPMVDKETMFEKEFKRTNSSINVDNFSALMPKMSKLEQLVFEYNIVKNSIISLYTEKEKTLKLFEGLNIKQEIGIVDAFRISKSPLSLNEMIEKITLEYWNKFITETDFKSKLPSELRDNFTYNMDRQADIDFSIDNVRYFYEELCASIPESYQKTCSTVFDKLTSKYSYSEASWCKNIWGYNGWRSNNAYMIKGKSIIPCYLEYSFKCIPDVLKDLNIIFNNLSGKNYYIDTDEIREKVMHCEKSIDLGHFIIDVYKKGTIHIKYKNERLLKQFNILVGKGKNWLPDDFMTKNYNDMNEEEKRLVKEFGFKPFEYDEIVSNNKQYISLQLN